MIRSFSVTICVLFAFCHSGFGAAPDATGVEFFETKIRPVLVQQCYACHSADAAKAKKLRGDLYLDQKAGLLKGGTHGPVLVPGKPNESLLIKALRHDAKPKMPPAGKLDDAIIADFVKWIEMGAPDPRESTAPIAKGPDLEAGRRWWAFLPLSHKAPPAVKNQAWVRTAIDRFILAALEEKKLTPNAITTPEKLVRRAFYDLTGLPPSADDVTKFVQDYQANPKAAWEKLLDRLLASERYGERWGRHWLDVVRFAESGGYEFDKDRPGAYHYRDFVIKAMNQDMPFDEFARLQIAGDHLQPESPLAVAATGFIVAGPYPGQTTQKTLSLIRYNHLDDMVSTLGSSLLGLSIACARCHDHKYDPISQLDYYRLTANLARTDSVEKKVDLDPEATKKAKTAYDLERSPFLAAKDRFEKDELPKRVAAWYTKAKSLPVARWAVLEPASMTAVKASLKRLDDGLILAFGANENNESYTFKVNTDLRGITALRLEILADPSLPKNGPGRAADGKFMLSDIVVTAVPIAGKGKSTPVKLKPITASHEATTKLLAGLVDDDRATGWSSGAAGKDASVLFEIEDDLGFAGGANLTISLRFGDTLGVGRVRLSLSTMPRPAILEGESAPQAQVEFLKALESSQGKMTPANREIVARGYRKHDAEMEKIYAAVEEHAKKEPQPTTASIFAATSGKGGDVHFLIRGEVDRKADLAKPGYMQVLTNGPEATWDAKISPRVSLANWLTDVEQGAGRLLARVIVNRIWQHHFGRGIVSTTNDFGIQGEAPTHPELLDYLASELIRNGWKMKPIHKLIMTSAVYQQRGDANAANQKIDPANRLWWRLPARRLEAEAIRDAVLEVSGTLDPKMYGPGTLDGNGNRRSIYLTVKRSQMVPMMQMFDSPEAMQSIGERSTTTVATQSLAFMNSPFIRTRAEKLALLIKPKTGDVAAAAIDQAYLATLSRQPTTAERERAVNFMKNQTQKYGAVPKAVDLALADFCQILFCLNEFVYVD